MAYSDTQFSWSVTGNFNATNHLLWSNVFAGSSTASLDPGVIGADFFSAWEAAWLPIMANEIVVTGWRCVNLGTKVAAETPLSTSGTGSTNSMPSNVAALFNHTTAETGKSGRGRTFVAYPAPVAPDAGDPSLWDGTTIGDIGGAGSTFKSSLLGTASNIVWAVNSRKLEVLYDIIASTLDHTVAQMGKRRYG